MTWGWTVEIVSHIIINVRYVQLGHVIHIRVLTRNVITVNLGFSVVSGPLIVIAVQVVIMTLLELPQPAKVAPRVFSQRLIAVGGYHRVPSVHLDDTNHPKRKMNVLGVQRANIII